MESQTETFEVVADSIGEAVSRMARECRSAAVTGLEIERKTTYPETVYTVAITKVRSSSGARSVSRIEKWRTERTVLLRKADELIQRLRKIEDRTKVLERRLRDAGEDPE